MKIHEKDMRNRNTRKRKKCMKIFHALYMFNVYVRACVLKYADK